MINLDKLELKVIMPTCMISLTFMFLHMFLVEIKIFLGCN